MSLISFKCDFTAANNQLLIYAYFLVAISLKQEQQYKFMYCCSDKNMILVRLVLSAYY